MEAGVSNHVWEVEEILSMMDAKEQNAGAA